ncbi:MAG: geranylgeranyl reductase family protein [Dehalococcoidia bacterium]|nr:MAG: geranylgeranyl reductase family protein [Dehalococcoidia bacterium]
MDYDVIVVGAGPAGSTLARLLAGQGVRVLLLDRARFPRDKPCGGTVTVRAASHLDIDLAPVVERTIFAGRFTYRLGKAFRHRSDQPLTFMTQRHRLDLFLAEQAAAAGAQFHDGEPVRAAEAAERTVTVRTDKGHYTARALAGADGANGIVGQSTGAAPRVDLLVGLERNVPLEETVEHRWEDTVALDLGALPGGYGWVFPKGNHLNVGVGAWRHFAPHLRRRLADLCQRYRLPSDRLSELRGHHLPLRRPGSPIARGPAVTLGDAAGLVDPLSGEGIHTAFLSARLAAEAIMRYLEEQTADLSSYQAAVDREIMPELIASRKLQDTFHYAPYPYAFVLQYSDRFWRLFCRLIRGETTYVGLLRMVGPLGWLVDGWDIVARRSRYSLPAEKLRKGLKR